MKWLLFGVLLCCLLLFHVSCTGSEETQSDANYILLTEEDNGRAVEIDIESKIVIELESNPSTGYKWEQMNPDGNFIYQEHEAIFLANEDCEEMTGCGGIEQFIFKASRTGEGAVSLIYHRYEGEAIDQFHVDVVVID